MQVTRSGTLAAGSASVPGSTQTASLRYFHHDQLGSVAAVTDEAGTVIERMAYDPWGKRRGADGVADTTDSLVGRTTDRGFTEHEHLDEMGLVHMNGRIYDPLVGRFMSADPFIQAPGDLQSYNRYAYVMNNPLNLTDPSGYFSLRGFLRNPFTSFNNHGDRVGGAIMGLPFGPKGYHAVFNFLQGSGGYQIKSAVISVLSIYCGYAAAACNGGGQAGLAKAYGASDWDAFTTGGQAALSTGAFTLAGSVGGGSYWAHAAAGCVSAAVGGGNCGQGAASAVFGKFATKAIDAQPGQFDAFQAAATVVAGGVGSVIGGGKFANGAKTAAYGYLYNFMSGSFDKSTGRLMITDNETGESKSIAAFSGDDRHKAIPNGDYLIVQHPTQGWFRLEPIDQSIGNDRWDSGSEAGRNQFRLHEGTVSYGCITCIEDSKAFMKFILSTSLTGTMQAVRPDTFINRNFRSSTETLKVYGIIRVTGKSAP
jgi:RHS repeat-associated protein